jgi:hypothetical protein
VSVFASGGATRFIVGRGRRLLTFIFLPRHRVDDYILYMCRLRRRYFSDRGIGGPGRLVTPLERFQANE